jgi:hypothetical protein
MSQPPIKMKAFAQGVLDTPKSALKLGVWTQARTKHAVLNLRRTEEPVRNGVGPIVNCEEAEGGQSSDHRTYLDRLNIFLT